MTFYVPGTTGVAWCILFYILIYSSPRQHPRISKAEMEYLCNSNNCSKGSGSKLEVPWMKMFRSKAVHALWITHMCSAFGFYLLAINLSLFIREALGFKVINVRLDTSYSTTTFLSSTQNGMLSMLPQLGMLLLSLAGKIFDYLRSKNLCSVNTLRKIFNSIGFFCPALTFICVQLLPCYMKVNHWWI